MEDQDADATAGAGPKTHDRGGRGPDGGKSHKGKAGKASHRQRKAEGRRRLSLGKLGAGHSRDAASDRGAPFEFVPPPPSHNAARLRYVGAFPFDAGAYPGYQPVRTHPAARLAPEAGEATTHVFIVAPARPSRPSPGLSPASSRGGLDESGA